MNKLRHGLGHYNVMFFIGEDFPLYLEIKCVVIKQINTIQQSKPPGILICFNENISRKIKLWIDTELEVHQYVNIDI